MHMRLLKSIDEIYDEVKDYGLVITNDVALETALNARISTARIGSLACTPRHIVGQLGPVILGRPFMTDLELIAAVSEETGCPFRQVYSEILNFREIRRYTKEVRTYLNTANSRRIHASYSAMPTLERAMSLFDPDDERVGWFFDRVGKVAVIGVDLFDDLDKHCIPMDADIIEIFKDGEFEMGTIHEIGNDRSLAENAAELIDKSKATDYAIVMSASDPIADSVRASLYRRGIPFVNSLNVKDLAQIRDFIGFLNLALSYRTVRVKAVKEIFSTYNGFFKPGREEYLLSKQDREDMRDHAYELKECMRAIVEDGLTFGQVRDAVCNRQVRPQVTMLLEELGVTDQIVTPDRVSDVRFAVENVQELKHNEQIPVNELRGVLLADCKNSVFVDRPVVIYLGMEQEWNIPVVGRRYMDAEAESDKNAMRLEALVQQGQVRFYCVNANKKGKPARPCLTFDSIESGSCDTFGDLGEIVRGRWAAPMEPVESFRGTELIDDIGEFDDPFSKSTLNAYVACPRRYMFRELLPSSDKTYTEFGNLIHEFAELYCTHGDVVREKGVDGFTTMISDRYAGLSTPLMTDLDVDRIRIAMTNVMRYIDRYGVRCALDSRNSSKSRPNRFLQELGLDETSTCCETDHRSASNPIHGVFDLMCDGIVTDYKTGKGKTLNELSKAMSYTDISGEPEFQPLMYLALAIEAEGSCVGFNQLYAMDNDVESASPDFDVSRNVRTVKLTDMDARRYVLDSPEGATMMSGKLGKDFSPYARQILDAVVAFGGPDPKTWRDDPELKSRILRIVRKNPTDANLNSASAALGKIADAVTGGMVVDGESLVVPLGYLQGFLEFVDGMHTTMVGGRTTDLPANPAPKVVCEQCDFYMACTRCRVKIGGESNERSQRQAEAHRRDAGRDGHRRCRTRDRQDSHHRSEVRESRLQGGRLPEGRADAHIHPQRRHGDGGTHQGRPRSDRERRGLLREASPGHDVRRILPLGGHGIPRGRREAVRHR